MQKHTPSVLITALTQTLDRNTQAQILKGLADKGIKEQTQMSQDTADKLTSLQKQIEKMAVENKTLNENEIKAIESAMSDVLKSLEDKGLFSLIVPVNGKNYSIKDIATALANMPVVVRETANYNEGKTEIVSVTFALSNNTESVMTPEVKEDENFRTHKFSGNFNDVPATFDVLYHKSATTVNDVSIPEYILSYATNITFDITQGMKEAQEFTAKDVAKDINGDGVIGGDQVALTTDATADKSTGIPAQESQTFGDGVVL